MYSVRRAIQADIQVDFFVPFTKMTILYSSNIWPLCLHLSLSELVTCLWWGFFLAKPQCWKSETSFRACFNYLRSEHHGSFFFHFLCFEGIVIRLWGHFWLSFHSTWLNRSECCLCLVRYGGEGERQSKGWRVAPWSVGSLCGYKERRHLWLHLVRLIESSAARNCLWRKWDFPLPKCISQHSLFQAIHQGSVQFSVFSASLLHLTSPTHTHLLVGSRRPTRRCVT